MLIQGKKILIGMVHLLPLPGSPQFNRNFTKIEQRAILEAKNLEDGGMNAIMIENFGDIPFFPKAPPETITAMASIARIVRENINIPIGINVLRNDPIAALAIAKVVKASFIRVNVHMGTYVTDQGVIEGTASETMRYRKHLDAENIEVFADVQVKHAQRLTPMPIEEEAKEIVERGIADGIIVTGHATGTATNLNDLILVRKTLPESIPIICGSGATSSTISKILEIANGVIVGTALKKDRNLANPVDIDLIREFVQKVRV